MFNFHNKSRFEVICYSISSSDNSFLRKKIDQSNIIMRDISLMHNGDAAELIAKDGVNILINLCGFNKYARNEIFALRPASIQVKLL